MKAEKYLIIVLGIPEGSDLNEVYVPASIIPEVLDNFKKGLLKKIKVDYAPAEEEMFYLERCPTCNSSDIGKLDEKHDICASCKTYWRVK